MCEWDRMLLAPIQARSEVDPLEQCSHVAQGLGSLHLPSGGAWSTVKAMETIPRSQIWVLWNFILDALHSCSLHSSYPAPQQEPGNAGKFFVLLVVGLNTSLPGLPFEITCWHCKLLSVSVVPAQVWRWFRYVNLRQGSRARF